MQCFDPDDYDLFAIREEPAGIVVGMEALARTSARAKNAAMIEALIPIAQSLAQNNPEGITVTELRKAAVARGLLTGRETGYALSYLGSVMRAAGLRPGGMRRSSLTSTHGRHQTIWFI